MKAKAKAKKDGEAMCAFSKAQMVMATAMMLFVPTKSSSGGHGRHYAPFWWPWGANWSKKRRVKKRP